MRGMRGMNRFAMNALKGIVGGLVVSVPLSFLASRGAAAGVPLAEIGERGGAIAASYLGGTEGQVGFQILDGVLQRVITSNVGGQTGIGAVGGLVAYN